MPTIDQLAPATAASDTDEIVLSKNGIVRKATRAQLLAGVQPQLAVSPGHYWAVSAMVSAAPS